MTDLFQKLGHEAFAAGVTPRTNASRTWFQRRVASLKGGDVNRKKLLGSKFVDKDASAVLGSMNMWYYDPKHKLTLPYYDRFPLGIIVGPAPSGFHAINLHYLPLELRAKFLAALMDVTSNKAYTKATKFRLTYDMLKASQKLKYFKPCFKHYLTAHVRSHFARIPSGEWEIATFLPTAQFKGASASTIYKDSKGSI